VSWVAGPVHACWELLLLVGFMSAVNRIMPLALQWDWMLAVLVDDPVVCVNF